jgi:hypothetical protein
VLGNCWKLFQLFPSSTPISWQDAEIRCVAWRGHLASISSADEQATAVSITAGQTTWIGYRDPHTDDLNSHSVSDWSNFVWSDGSPGGMSAYSNWRSGDPQNAVGPWGSEYGEYCTAINWDQVGAWVDLACSKNEKADGTWLGVFSFLCKKPDVVCTSCGAGERWILLVCHWMPSYTT